jgi:hypothetical protein
MRVLVGLLAALSGVAPAGAVDERQVLDLGEHQRALVLQEMRALLSATQAVVAALAAGDMAAVARHASAVGMGMAHQAEHHLQGALPEAFMQMGMSVHRDFDRIAADAEAVGDPKHTLRQLGESMQKCVACHASYQIRLAPAASGTEAPVR